MKAIFRDDWGLTLFGFICTLVVVVSAFVAATLAVVGVIAYYGERASCNAFGEQTSRTVRFVHLVDPGVPLSWDCLVRTADGRWISRSQLRSVDES